jgi:DNA polymerase, archaea type
VKFTKNIDNDVLYNNVLQDLKEGYAVDIISDNTIRLMDETIVFSEKYQSVVSQLESGDYQYQDAVIYGKGWYERITNIDVKDDLVYLFYQDGSHTALPMVYWFLTTDKMGSKGKRLKGQQHYKYIHTFDTMNEYRNALRSIGRKDKYVQWDVVEQAMTYYGLTYFKGLKVENVSVLSWDIEANGLQKNEESLVFLITNTFYDGNGNISKRHFRLDHYEDCGEMIDAWCSYVQEINPAIINGHNILGYDLPYIEHVAKMYNSSLKLGRDGSEVTFKTKPRNYRVDGSQTWAFHDVLCFGREVIDGMFLAVKYDIGRNYPSWNLKAIAEHEGLVKEGRQFYDAAKIKTDWWNEEKRELIVQYGIDDSDDSYNLYNLHVPSFFYLCQNIPKPFQALINSASGNWLNGLFVRSYIQDGYSIPKSEEIKGFEGAYSYGVPGIYSNMYKVDVASLYPSIMRHWKVCNKEKDYLKLFPHVVETFTLERLKNKKIAKDTNDSYYKALEQSQKVVINSLYGFLGATGLNFNSQFHASFVTRKGREILDSAIIFSTKKPLDFWKQADRDMSDCPYHLVNCDTDSIMICKPDQSPWNKLERDRYLKDLNAQFPELIAWEDDGYYTRGVINKTKNYVLLEEGSTKVKYKGSSFSDPKREPALTEFLQSVIEDCLIYEKSNYLDLYNGCVEEALNITDMSRWAVKKSITETLLSSDRTNETKVVDALMGTDYSIGDKVFLFYKIDGKIQATKDGEPVFLKSGAPKMVENKILCRVETFDGNYDMWHYVSRVYTTLKILENVINMKNVINYSLKVNQGLLDVGTR